MRSVVLGHGLRTSAVPVIAYLGVRLRQSSRRGGRVETIFNWDWLERPDPEAWSRAADAWARLGQPFEQAYARWRQGAALLATRSDRRETEAALREARALAVDLGAGPLRAEVEDLARRARLDIMGPADLASPEPSPPESPAEAVGLTKREAEVLSLVAAGRSNRQIGAALFMSEKTASVHVSRILTKLEVSSRGEAAALAHRLGLVENAGG